jgi:hypothetical protein
MMMLNHSDQPEGNFAEPPKPVIIVSIAMTHKIIRFFKEEPKQPGKGTLLAGLAINIILLYVVNNLRYMGITILTEDKLVSCMWSLNILFGIGILGNFLVIIYRPVWFFNLVQTLYNASGINAFFFIFKLYPFSLDDAMINTTIKIILVLIMVGFFFAFLVEFYHCGVNFELPKKKTSKPVEPLAGEATEYTPPGDLSITTNQQPETGNQTAATPDVSVTAPVNAEPKRTEDEAGTQESNPQSG